METWYRTVRSLYGAKIKPVNVVKSTNKTITIESMDLNGHKNESRSAITSIHFQHFKTWEEARQHLLTLAECEVASLRLSLERANGSLGTIRGMKEPRVRGYVDGQIKPEGVA